MSTSSIPHRIETHGRGSGEIGDNEIAQRATEIARADGRDRVNPGDVTAAHDELADPLRKSAPLELSHDLPDRTAGDEVPGENGVITATPRLDDSETASADLFAEGLEEADRDTRTASADKYQN